MRIVSPDQPFNARMAILGAGNHYRRGSSQPSERLAKPPEWKDAAAERIQGIDQDNVEVARQAEVLEAVIQQEHAGVQLPLHPAARLIAIGTDAHMRDGSLYVHLSLVTGLLHRSQCAAWNDYLQARFAAVTTRKDRRTTPRFGQLLRQMGDQRRLPRPAHCERADTDHGSIQLFGMCPRHVYGVARRPYGRQRP